MGTGETGFNDAYDDTPPWDIGRPQREIVRLAEAEEITGDVLDMGCGTGENALWLADQGYDVCGIDAAPKAIAKAERKASGRGIDAAFLTHDAFDLGTLDRRFDTVIDCGLFHVFSPACGHTQSHTNMVDKNHFKSMNVGRGMRKWADRCAS